MAGHKERETAPIISARVRMRAKPQKPKDFSMAGHKPYRRCSGITLAGSCNFKSDHPQGLGTYFRKDA